MGILLVVFFKFDKLGDAVFTMRWKSININNSKDKPISLQVRIVTAIQIFNLATSTETGTNDVKEVGSRIPQIRRLCLNLASQ